MKVYRALFLVSLFLLAALAGYIFHYFDKESGGWIMGSVYYLYHMGGDSVVIEWENIWSLIQWIILVPTVLTLAIDIAWSFLEAKLKKQKLKIRSVMVVSRMVSPLWCVYVASVFLSLLWILTG